MDGWIEVSIFFLLLLIDSVCDNNCVQSLLPRQATISQLPIIMAFFLKKKRRKNKNYGALPFFFKQKLFLLFFEFQRLGGLFID